MAEDQREMRWNICQSGNIFKVPIWQLFASFLIFGKMLNLLWRFLSPIGPIFYSYKWANVKKQCSHLVTLD